MLATTTAKAETHSEIRRQKHRTVALVITSYFIVSILMVFLNKALMTKPGASIPAPLFVVWYQCLVTVAICWGMGYLGQLGFYHFRVRRPALCMSARCVRADVANSIRRSSYLDVKTDTSRIVDEICCDSSCLHANCLVFLPAGGFLTVIGVA